MAQYLGNMNLPARSDILDLGDRLGRLEDSIAALQAEVRNLRESGKPATAPARPRRTKQPPASEEA